MKPITKIRENLAQVEILLAYEGIDDLAKKQLRLARQRLAAELAPYDEHDRKVLDN